MYDTLSQFHGEKNYLSSLFHGISIFLLSFSISMALSVFFGLLDSLTLKHSYLSFYPSLESCFVALAAYTYFQQYANIGHGVPAPSSSVLLPSPCLLL